MAEKSKIGWTDHTFNSWVGCQKVSDGCKNCYAEVQMTRKSRWKNTWGAPETSERIRTKDWSKPLKWNKQPWYECPACGWRGSEKEIEYYDGPLCPVHLEADCGYLEVTRQRVFCGSLMDWLEDNPALIETRHELRHLILATPNLDWLMLTKRIENYQSMCPDWCANGAPDNVWLGVTAENQEMLLERAVKLLGIPAKVHFFSLEPMLGPIDMVFPNEPNPHQDTWVIVGGESGTEHRPFKWDWARDVRDQCKAAGVPFYMKQGAGKSQRSMPEIPDDLKIKEFPK